MVSHHGQAACDVIVCWRSARAARAHTKCGPPLGSPICEKSQCNHDAIMITVMSHHGHSACKVIVRWQSARSACASEVLAGTGIRKFPHLHDADETSERYVGSKTPGGAGTDTSLGHVGTEQSPGLFLNRFGSGRKVEGIDVCHVGPTHQRTPNLNTWMQYQNFRLM
jgi:hypothetical protein